MTWADLSGQPPTLKHIDAEVRQWLVAAEQHECSALLLRIEQLVEAIREAAGAIHSDLEARPAAPEFRDLLSGSAGAYADLEECLQEISAGVAASDPGRVKEELLYLKAGTASLKQFADATENWLNAPILRCPRCGATDGDPDEVCRHCDLELLYPDLHPDVAASRQYLTLGAPYVEVYRAYLSILAGERPLEDLAAPLEALRLWLHHHADLSRLTRDVSLKERLLSIEQCCADALWGVEQMSLCYDSRESSDLNQGWQRIFAAGADLQKALPGLLQDLGVETEPTSHAGGDTIQLTNE